MSKDTFYFPHDYNTRSDPKIKKLIRKHGFIGYGIYWAIVEDLYDNANALPTDYETIAYDFRTDENTITSIINDFELFIIDGEEFGSSSIERRLNERDAKSAKARKSARKRWDKVKEDANALPTESDPNAIKESKSKENKPNESKENIDSAPAPFMFKKSLLDYGLEKQLVDDWLKIRKNKKATNTETSLKSFISEIEKTGREKNEVFKIIVESGWSGFKATWLDKEDNSDPTGRKQTKDITDFEY